jgi:YtkA-like protein
MSRRRVLVYGLAFLVVAASGGCGGRATALTELQRVRSGMLDVVLLSPHEILRHGKDDFIVEFRSADGGLIDVGDVRANASMPMPGMPMFGSIDVHKTDTPGRYAANGEFSMAGTWRVTVEWNGSAGRDAVNFSGTVH